MMVAALRPGWCSQVLDNLVVAGVAIAAVSNWRMKIPWEPLLVCLEAIGQSHGADKDHSGYQSFEVDESSSGACQSPEEGCCLAVDHLAGAVGGRETMMALAVMVASGLVDLWTGVDEFFLHDPGAENSNWVRRLTLVEHEQWISLAA